MASFAETMQPGRMENWRTAGLHLVYPAPLLRRIAAHVVERYLSIPKGGVEVGGLLLGEHRDGTIRLAAELPIACEYASGPSFSLSPSDEQSLERLLEEVRRDPQYNGLEVVGWYHSHTRSEPELTEADRLLHERFFPEPWQIALIVKPHKFDPSRIAVFRSGSPSWGVAPDGEFPVDLKLRGEAAPLAEVESVPMIEAVPKIVAAPAVEIMPRRVELAVVDAVPMISATPRRNYVPVAAVLAVLALAGAGIFYYYGSSRVHTPQTAIARPDLIRLQASGNAVVLDWDRNAPEIQNAEGAILQIRDGEAPESTVMLDKPTLRAGNFTYLRNSRNVLARLTIQMPNGPPVEAIARLLLPEAPPPAEPAQDTGAVTPVQAAVKTEERTPESATPGQDSSRARLSSEVALRSPDTSRRFIPPQAPRAATPHGATPSILEGPSGVVAATGSLPVSAPVFGVDSSAMAPPPSAPTPQFHSQHGRLIWTGDLRRGESLVLGPRNASAGNVSGSWPPGPANFRIQTAELRDGSVVVYTANTNRPSLSETPGPQNGWNVMVYRFDPGRAAGVSVTENPGSANGWKRIGLRAQDKRVSVVVVDWTTVDPQSFRR